MEFKRVLGLRTIVTTSAGLTLAASTFVAAAQMAAMLLGNSAWIAILVAGLLCLLAGACFSELNGILPSAAGLRLYVSRAWGEKAAMTISLLYMAVVTTVVGTEAFVLAKVLNKLIPLNPMIWVVVLMGLATLLNIRGIKIAGGFQDFITFFMMISLVALGVIALSKAGFQLGNVLDIGGTTPDGGLISAIGAGVFLYVGFEWVTPLAEEVTDHKLVSRGMFIAIGLLAVVYAIFTVAMRQFVPMSDLADSPIPHMLLGEALLGPAGLIWMGIVSICCSTTTFNAGIITISRFMYASAREGILPKFFAKFNPRYATPQNAILALFVVGIVASGMVYWTQKYLTLIYVGAAMESISYAVAAAVVITLRRKLKDAERPFKVPGGVWAAGLTIVVFLGLAEQVIETSPAAGLYLLVGTVICFAYVQWVVPKIQARRAAERAAAAAARGGRRPATVRDA